MLEIIDRGLMPMTNNMGVAGTGNKSASIYLNSGLKAFYVDEKSNNNWRLLFTNSRLTIEKHDRALKTQVVAYSELWTNIVPTIEGTNGYSEHIVMQGSKLYFVVVCYDSVYGNSCKYVDSVNDGSKFRCVPYVFEYDTLLNTVVAKQPSINISDNTDTTTSGGLIVYPDTANSIIGADFQAVYSKTGEPIGFSCYRSTSGKIENVYVDLLGNYYININSKIGTFDEIWDISFSTFGEKMYIVDGDIIRIYLVYTNDNYGTTDYDKQIVRNISFNYKTGVKDVIRELYRYTVKSNATTCKLMFISSKIYVHVVRDVSKNSIVDVFDITDELAIKRTEYRLAFAVQASRWSKLLNFNRISSVPVLKLISTEDTTLHNDYQINDLSAGYTYLINSVALLNFGMREFMGVKVGDRWKTNSAGCCGYFTVNPFKVLLTFDNANEMYTCNESNAYIGIVAGTDEVILTTEENVVFK